MGRVVPILVSLLIRHSLLSLPFEAKLILVTIFPTIATMKLYGLRMGLLNWFLSTRLLNRFFLTRFLTDSSPLAFSLSFPKEHFPQSAQKLDGLLEIICLWRKHGWSWGFV
jgi:hypothetical protein